jgi:hypothetical protein
MYRVDPEAGTFKMIKVSSILKGDSILSLGLLIEFEKRENDVSTVIERNNTKERFYFQ